MVPGVKNSTINIDGNNVILTLSWGEPFNNFDPIVSYTVSCSSDDTCPPSFTTTDNTTRSYTITNLTAMTNYTFSVVATNSIGSGEAGVVMITTPPEEIITATTATSTTSTTITTTNSTTTTVISTVDATNITTTDSVITITSSPSSVPATFSSIAPVSSSIIMSSKNDYYCILKICYKAIKTL